jgi:hypothetical protein
LREKPCHQTIPCWRKTVGQTWAIVLGSDLTVEGQ